MVLFLLGLDSCSEDYEFCPNCRVDETPTKTSTVTVVTPTKTRPKTPTVTPEETLTEME